MEWDSGESANWSDASLQETLNGDYLNRVGDYNSNGITRATRDIIETVTWKLGGMPNDSNSLASQFYGYERGTNVISGNDTTWTGKIALIYPSDYGFATSGGSMGRDTCLSYAIRDWRDYNECINNDWINMGSLQWTLTHNSQSSYDRFIIAIAAAGPYSNLVSYNANVRPSLYLNDNVSITGGTGTSTNPYTMQLNT